MNAPIQISALAKPNKAIAVTVSINAGGKVYSLQQSVMVSFAQTIKQAANENIVSRMQILSQYIVTQLAKEWDDEKSLIDFTNDYEKKPLETLLGQFVQAVQTLTPAEQQKLSVLVPSISSVYGKRPGGFSKNKGKWDAASKLLGQINVKRP